MFKINKQVLYQFLFISFLLYGPVIVLLGIRIDFRISILFITFFLFYIYLLKKGTLFIKPKKLIVSIYTILGLILIYMLFIVLHLNDMYMLNLSIRLIIFFTLTLLIIKYFQENKIFFRYFFDFLFYATALNSLSILLVAFIDPLREFIQTYQLQIVLLQVSGEIRMMALNGLAGSTLSLYTFFGFVAYFYTYSKPSLVKNISLLIILISFLYSGRTGLIFTILYVFIKVFIFLKKNTNIIVSILLYIIFLLMVLLLGDLFVSNLDLFSKEIIYTFRFFSSMYTTETGLPLTIEFLLKNSLFLPSENILFGSIGYCEYNNGELHSDIGYIKMLFNIGIVGQLLFSILYLFILIYALSYRRYEKSFNYSIILIIFIFVFHLKGLSLGSTLSTFILFLSFFVSYYRMKYINIHTQYQVTKLNVSEQLTN